MSPSTDPRRAAFDALADWWALAGSDLPPAPKTGRAPSRQRARDTSASSAASSATRSPARRAEAQSPSAPAKPDLEVEARKQAAACTTLAELKSALEALEHPLKASARSTVFARGDQDGDVMIIGEGPGRDEDAQGLPFVGRSGQLMDAMFAAIGLSAQSGLYLTNIVNWRPPGNRAPNDGEIALCRPFLERHIVLKAPKFIVPVGGPAAQTLLGAKQGIMRLRGRWADWTPPGGGEPIPMLPMLHPAFLLRKPLAKREFWADLLALQERLSTHV